MGVSYRLNPLEASNEGGKVNYARLGRVELGEERDALIGGAIDVERVEDLEKLWWGANSL